MPQEFDEAMEEAALYDLRPYAMNKVRSPEEGDMVQRLAQEQTRAVRDLGRLSRFVGEHFPLDPYNGDTVGTVITILQLYNKQYAEWVRLVTYLNTQYPEKTLPHAKTVDRVIALLSPRTPLATQPEYY